MINESLYDKKNLFSLESVTQTTGFCTVFLQEVPEKLLLVSRPLKERFVMNPQGGELHSSALPDVGIVFPPQTLNTSTKVILQVFCRIF